MTDSQFIRLAEGGQLNSRIEGPASEPWVIFSNSLLTDLSIWDQQTTALASRYRVLRYDQRGHGRSSLPEGPMSFEQYGSDLVTVLKANGITDCIFVGLSMGVPTGLAAYGLAPERFAGFVAVDGIAKSAPGREAFWVERRETAQAVGLAELAKETSTRWLPGVSDESGVAKALTQMTAATPIEGFAAATHALQSYDLTAIVNELTCPFLGIAGALDGTMPDAVRAQFGSVPLAEFVDIPEAGHLPNYQCPEAFNAALLSFLGRITPRPITEAS